jgi:NAD(P)H-dependent flavin oxidoreductase YrpB (nitropropane dioxygenase family)
MKPPRIIQGGMGFAVSGWGLARSVSRLGLLGVVSGAGLDLLVTRTLQSGDPGGHIRRALAHFPVPEIAQRILARHEIPGGKPVSDPFRPIPMWTATPSLSLQQLAIAANFVEVFLAKEGHDGLVGINYLEKVQLPMLPSIYGAMLAGVDYVLMGAGLPREIPGVLDRLAENQDVELSLHVEGAAAADNFRLRFSPRAVFGDALPRLRRPRFLAIVASNVLAALMAKNTTGRVDGFVIEGQSAGGHNAPPRGPLVLNAFGEPEYGPRNIVDTDAIRKLGLPFWMAGSYASAERLRAAETLGAAGIQVGTAFAFARESGITSDLKRAVIAKARSGPIRVFTDPNASPTGFPFKVVPLAGSLSERDVYAARPRKCDLGYLRHPYRKPDGSVGYRCPAEPAEDYMRKGGDAADTAGRKCLCNCLLANVGLAQLQDDGYVEKPMLTSGDELDIVTRILAWGAESYGADDGVRYLTETEATGVTEP